MRDSHIVDENSAIALQLEPWLAERNPITQLARNQAPWHLWLEKFSFAFVRRLDVASAHWRSLAAEARDLGQDETAKGFRDKASSLPSGKFGALSVSVNLASRANLPGLLSACETRFRWLDQLAAQLTAVRFRQVEVVNVSRLLLHLGRASVLENVGLYAERTTGLPLIPGTAVKGVLSTWACWEGHWKPETSEFIPFQTDASDRETHSTLRRNLPIESASERAVRVLGADSGDAHAGEIVFLGGFPAAVPELELDIVTPHGHDGYADPVPSHFLAITPGTLWRFPFYVRPEVDDPGGLLKTTSDWMFEALTQLGIGAKTAAGYGRFRAADAHDREEAAQRWKAQAQTAQEVARDLQGTRETAATKAQAAANLKSDFSNEDTFKNEVLRLMDNKGQWQHLQKAAEKLRKPENAEWLKRFKEAATGKAYKDLRKQEWLKDLFPS
ncbi:MAG: type III-B CRISPR module RAMP protein Cmr6 [Verrucomicrobiota bacterium]